MRRAEQQTERVLPQNEVAEISVLGAILQNAQAVAEAIEVLQPEDFFTSVHQNVFAACQHLFNANGAVDIVTVGQEMMRRGTLERATYLMELVDAVPTAANVRHHAAIVKEKATMRRIIESGRAIVARAYEDQDAASAVLDWAEQQLFNVSQGRAKASFIEVKTLLRPVFEQMEAVYERKEAVTGIATSFARLDEMTTGFQASDLVVLAARPSMGKAQPLDALVKTPTAWKQIGDLEIGDALASVDGEPSFVDGIFPQGEEQVYRIEFSDGRWTECSAGHLWTVTYRDWDGPKTLTTAKLINMLTKKRYQYRLWIDMASGDWGHNNELPIDPWLLGVLLGDGGLSHGVTPTISSVDDEILDRVREKISPELELNFGNGCTWRIAQVGSQRRPGRYGVWPNPLGEALKQLGLQGHLSEDKFIPISYATASRDVRLALLQGLLDTDGGVEKFGTVRFSTCSHKLATDVVCLARSLGAWCSMTTSKKHYTHNGERREAQLAYVCTISHPDPKSLFTLTRKKVRCRRVRTKRAIIVSITPTRFTETRCIKVSHPSQLYITDDYVVTHNTSFALNLADHVATTTQTPVAVFSLEMTKEQLVQRLLCARARVESRKIRTGYIRDVDWPRLTAAAGVLSGAPIYIDDSSAQTVLEMRAKARRLKSEKGLGLVIIDYLQLITGMRRHEGRVQEVSEISRSLKMMAKDLGVPVVALSQLSRAVEQRQPPRPQLSDLRESGSIEQDADVVVFLYRPAFYQIKDRDEEEKDAPPIIDNTTEVIVGKQRNGPTGTVYLAFLQDCGVFVAQERKREL